MYWIAVATHFGLAVSGAYGAAMFALGLAE
jgi:hypothetical protein